jgi:hypothetical protein
MARQAVLVPAGMRGVHGRFMRWRQSHAGRRPIPESLWKAAAELAREHGVFQTAKALRLDYVKLKQLTTSASSIRGKAVRPPVGPAAFRELLAPRTAGALECLIELEGPHGKMRIQWKGATGADLAGLSRVLWESA